jgi:hypothetical protein
MTRGGWAVVALVLFACGESVPSATPSSDAGTEAATAPVDAGAGDACAPACGRPCATPTIAELSRDIDNQFRIRAASRAACTAEDLALLEAKLAGPEPPGTYLAYGDGLGEACRACVVSKDTDREWGPIVATASDPSRGFLDLYGCYGIVEGVACGQAVAMDMFCRRVACEACASSERAACADAAASGICAEFAANTVKSCPALETTRVTCATILDAVRVHCAAPADGGAGDGG